LRSLGVTTTVSDPGLEHEVGETDGPEWLVGVRSGSLKPVGPLGVQGVVLTRRVNGLGDEKGDRSCCAGVTRGRLLDATHRFLEERQRLQRPTLSQEALAEALGDELALVVVGELLKNPRYSARPVSRSAGSGTPSTSTLGCGGTGASMPPGP
jgi:hypothetical protein